MSINNPVVCSGFGYPLTVKINYSQWFRFAPGVTPGTTQCFFGTNGIFKYTDAISF